MTEYKCGSAESCKYGDMCKPKYDIGGCSHFKQKKPLAHFCDKCHGSGEVEMSNEEYLKQASTEELAKFLRQIYRDGRDDYVGEWYEQTEKDFEEWLKQPHTIKEKHDDNL